ncbi:hypothetical protein Agub_g14253 [Astrephomene gubernaculifera]|uniref:VASt domain-containing protein n=1 Tax=Astrephomene gubernaculifera TaxID=47775 RepID=A0AAD3E1B1_9CHLO|nr:hypothetical protein Agub_g14253 [Astrephomene gubernaculifera]
MKEIEVETVIEDCTAQRFYDAIYGDDEALRAFHAAINKDPNAVSSPWGPDGCRTVRFVMPMNVPAMLKKFIGKDAVPVVESQRLEWAPGRSAVTVTSEPALDFPGANKFTTAGSMTASNRPDGSCLLKAVVRCSAALPWPVQATVEGLMGVEATNSINTFVKWAREYYTRWNAEQKLQPEQPAPAPAAAATASLPRPPTSAASAAPEGAEQFYDAFEDEEELLRRPMGQSSQPEASVVPYQPPRLEDVIVDCLRRIQSSTSETASSLRTLEQLLRSMDDNMQDLRDKLVGKRPPAPKPASPPHHPAAAGAAAATTHGSPSPAATSSFVSSPHSSSSSSSFWSGYFSALATVSLVGGAAAFAYARYHGLAAGGGGGGGGR